MKNFKVIVPFLLVLLVAAFPSHAQTTTTTTTLSVAITDTASRIVTLASGTNVEANGFLYVDKELMAVVAAVNGSTTVWSVRRGAGGIIGTHASSAKVYVASSGSMSRNVFRTYALPVGGSCTATAEAYLPVLNVNDGTEYNCVGSKWVVTNGVPITAIACGTANACSPAAKPTMRIVQGITAALDGASPAVAAVTGISPAFTSTTSYTCTGNSEGATAATALALAVTNVSTSAFTFTAANGSTAKVHWQCVGY